VNAPHDRALAALLEERQRRLDEAQDGKMVTLFDNTIMAVADVIRRIEAVSQKGVHAG